MYRYSCGNPFCISTHSLTKRLTGRLQGRKDCSTYFNSQPHEEADCIHRLCAFLKLYFNSQPHEEADSPAKVECLPVSYFNSQPHEEADRIAARSRFHIWISTHSLTKRLTLTMKYLWIFAGNFNSQPHEEADYF